MSYDPYLGYPSRSRSNANFFFFFVSESLRLWLTATVRMPLLRVFLRSILKTGACSSRFNTKRNKLNGVKRSF